MVFFAPEAVRTGGTLRNALLIILVLDNCHLNIVQHHANLNIRRKLCSKSPSLSPNPVKSKRITACFFD
jgi:hypothetical protein